MNHGRCPYYEYQADGEPLDPSSLTGQVSPIHLYEYCKHKHSPAPASVVLFMPGGRDLLKCGGALAKCQIPSHQRLDLESLT